MKYTLATVLVALSLSGLILAFRPPPPVNGAVQTSTINVTFSCSPSPGGAQCLEFLRLATDQLGWNAGLGVTRLNFLERQTVKHVIRLGRVQKIAEDTTATATSSGTNFDSAYVEP